MPQLNPSPWFPIFILAWLTMIVMLTKTLKTKTITPPLQKTSTSSLNFWTWPWP
uniref:ATP synthase complex subunit 8 n=1 Tax=Acanthodactylus aureus TaxID=111505 RepID=A0A8A3WK53_9SAUR|nr:ATP synthase F0 subunit 8 [Acanthodactylus aureus]